MRRRDGALDGWMGGSADQSLIGGWWDGLPDRDIPELLYSGMQ